MLLRWKVASMACTVTRNVCTNASKRISIQAENKKNSKITLLSVLNCHFFVPFYAPAVLSRK